MHKAQIKIITLAAIICLLVWQLAEPLILWINQGHRMMARWRQPVASLDEDLFEFVAKIQCPIQYSDGPFKYCFREIEALAQTLQLNSGRWTLDRVVEEHFKDLDPCPPIHGRQTSNGTLAYWPEAGAPQCHEIRNGRLLLIGASHRPEAGWFLGNELKTRTGWAATEAITTFYSEYGSCCESPWANCPISAGASECFSDYPALKWWNAHQDELSRFESWRVRQLEKAGLTAAEYRMRSAP